MPNTGSIIRATASVRRARTPMRCPTHTARVAALAFLAFMPALQTASADDREAAKKACAGDYKKHCTGILPGGGRVKKCLSDNLAKLEPPCREIVSRYAVDKKSQQAK